MKVRLEITALKTNGETTTVSARGGYQRAASWRNYDSWEFEVPEYAARKYRLGQSLDVEVTPR